MGQEGEGTDGRTDRLGHTGSDAWSNLGTEKGKDTTDRTYGDRSRTDVDGQMDRQTNNQRFTSTLKPLGLHHSPDFGVEEVVVREIIEQMFGMNL